MNELTNVPVSDVDILQEEDIGASFEPTLQNRLEILGEWMRKKYLSRLTEMQIAPITGLSPLEEDLIDNVRLYHVSEMVYQKGEPALDKFTTVFNTLSAYDATIFLILDADGQKTNIYLGVRNDETDPKVKRSSVTLGDSLKNALIGHFPGIRIEDVDRGKIEELSKRIEQQENLTSVSVAGNRKNKQDQTGEKFVQGLEKLLLSMQGRQYIGLIIADKKSSQEIELIRHNYQELYTRLSPLQKIQTTRGESTTDSRSKSFTEMSGKQKAAMIGGALAPIVTLAAGKAMAMGAVALKGVQAAGSVAQAMAQTANQAGSGIETIGMMIGVQAGSQLGHLINSLAPVETITKTVNSSQTMTVENKAVTDMLRRIDDILKRTEEYDSYNMWNVAGYFLSDDMSAAEIAAGNYRSLMNGDDSGREVSAINSWRSNNPNQLGDFHDLVLSLSRFRHPTFFYGYTGDFNNRVDASTSISGKELGLHIGLPRATVPGLPVIEHAEFGKEVYLYKESEDGRKDDQKGSTPQDRMTIGYVFDLGKNTGKLVELDNKSLTAHTFITGSTGSGKSKTVCQMLLELYQDHIPFLIVEPAKGEYKDRFGNLPYVNVYSTNPKVAPMLNINPFMFPESIHVLEHIDGLVEIFSVCWPMYDAMPAFFKKAILCAYEDVGWDLASSTFDGPEKEYPDFEDLVRQLDILIEQSNYASDIKSNYRGALITRVESLTVGLNKFLFTSEQTPYKKLFDENCVLDFSRVKSTETKALLMGLIVYILNEYRIAQKIESDSKLRHVTVLEEAHNLLKNQTEQRESNLVSKSVEMLTQTIAEIRSCGEGFIIVDQSPSSVDIAAIKNTNTKIVLRTPEANDREAVGRSMGLTPDQVNEIAMLPVGVAVVYQSDWVKPVLTKIKKVEKNRSHYIPPNTALIQTTRSARTILLKMLLQPYLDTVNIPEEKLKGALKVAELNKSDRKEIMNQIRRYHLFGGRLSWKKDDMGFLSHLIRAVLGIRMEDSRYIKSSAELEKLVGNRTKGFTRKEIQIICQKAILPYGGTGDEI